MRPMCSRVVGLQTGATGKIEPAAALLPVSSGDEAFSRGFSGLVSRQPFALGADPLVHDIRFVEDNWESPTLGAWGLG